VVALVGVFGLCLCSVSAALLVAGCDVGSFFVSSATETLITTERPTSSLAVQYGCTTTVLCIGNSAVTGRSMVESAVLLVGCFVFFPPHCCSNDLSLLSSSSVPDS